MSTAQPKDHLSQYLHTVSIIPRLSSEEEIALFKNDQKQKVVYHHLGYIPGLVKKYVTETADFEDLIQQGNLALAQAAERFDLSQNVRFITYAHFYIEKMVKEYITDARHPVKLRMNKAFRKILGSWRNVGVTPPLEYEDKKGIAEVLGVTIADVERFISWRYTPYLSIFSFDNEDEMSTIDELEDEDINVLSWMVNQEVDRVISESIAKLPPRLARILQDRTFADKLHAKKLDRLAREMGVSTERVRQLEKNAIDKLKEVIGERMLNELASR